MNIQGLNSYIIENYENSNLKIDNKNQLLDDEFVEINSGEGSCDNEMPDTIKERASQAANSALRMGEFLSLAGVIPGLKELPIANPLQMVGQFCTTVEQVKDIYNTAPTLVDENVDYWDKVTTGLDMTKKTLSIAGVVCAVAAAAPIINPSVGVVLLQTKGHVDMMATGFSYAKMAMKVYEQVQQALGDAKPAPASK